ncbi:unnamed protein product [Cochlearia groenlandica]
MFADLAYKRASRMAKASATRVDPTNRRPWECREIKEPSNSLNKRTSHPRCIDITNPRSSGKYPPRGLGERGPYLATPA